MGRPDTSSGGGGSFGGHSSSRSSGGHRVGSSGGRPMGSSSNFSGGGFRPSGGGHHHYHGGGYYGGYYPRSSSRIGTILVVIFFLVVFAIIGGAFGNNRQISTRNREKIENSVAYTNDCIKDELGYIEDPSALSKNLQNFYDRTGIQPYIYLKSYDDSLATDSEKETYAQEWYDANIDNEDTFLYMYFEDSDPNAVGYMAYVNLST